MTSFVSRRIRSSYVEPLSGLSRRSTPFLPDDDGCVAVVCSWCEEGASTSFVRISCGDHHTAAVTRDGQVILAGDNDFGELGKVSLLPSNPPLLVIYVSVSSLRLSSSPNLCFFFPVYLSRSCLSRRLDYSPCAFVVFFSTSGGVVLTSVCRGIMSRATCQRQFRPLLRETGG